MKMKRLLVVSALSALALSSVAHATPETTNSPTGGTLPAAVTQVGGLVVDLKGTNGARVVGQLAASQMYRGFADVSENPVSGVASGNPLLFGTQTGFTAAVLNALGGGLASASFRITLYDGDTAPGNFDFNENSFFVNGIEIGNWSDVPTYYTNGDGSTVFSSSTGFGNDILSTGFFALTDLTKLGDIYASLSSGTLAYTLTDTDPFDNFYDFTQGVDGGLINVGTGPVVTPPPVSGAVPEPTTWAMMIAGFGAAAAAMRRRRHKTLVSFA
jgi:hypothetical protein